MRLLVRPDRSSFQHFLQVCGFLPSKNSSRSCVIAREFCMLAKSADSSENLSPLLSTSSSSAKQHGRTVPMGEASKETQGNTQN
jgi:hypothetical protein